MGAAPRRRAGPARAGGSDLADLARSEMSLRRFLHGLPGVDQVGAEARAAGLATRSIKAAAKLWAIDTAISMIDLTTLEGADTPGKVQGAVRQGSPARPGRPERAAGGGRLRLPRPGRPSPGRRSAGSPASKVASVATAFPSGPGLAGGQAGRRRRRRGVGGRRGRHGDRPRRLPLRALRAGARRGRAVKEACGRAHLKVILETGELATYDNVRRACWIAMIGGRRLRQDLDRQGQPGRHPSRRAGDAGGGARLRRRPRGPPSG